MYIYIYMHDDTCIYMYDAYTNLSDTMMIPCSVYVTAKLISMDLIIFHQPCDNSVKY